MAKGGNWRNEMTRKWEISDLDGSNKRTVTLKQFRAELDAAKKRAMEIFNASLLAEQNRLNQ